MRSLRDYAVITGTYWVFTLTDGALRMLVLLRLYELGRTPIEIASLFLFYEFFGVLTNFVGGWLGARHGLKLTLFAGIALQVGALGLLAGAAASLTVPVVMLAQAISGTAKDLTKMSAKSYVKQVVREGDRRGLVRWVAILTGSKNTLKGVGFFLGGLLLATLGFRDACLAMAAVLMGALVVATVLLPAATGRAASKVGLRHLLSRDARVNWLAAARFFLFAARDIWFVLALPIFLASALGWSHPQVGAALAGWVIFYGLIQAAAPAYVGDGHGRLGMWTTALLLPLGGLLAALHLGAPPALTLAVGLGLFALVFATSSALHSYLIIAFADGDKVSLNVGFYYMANAAGRLTGTVLSGALFQWAGGGQSGLEACLVGALAFVAGSAVLCIPLRAAEAKAATG